jgi:prepilin-type N-terminal cleavage/methylation domain-containing protein
MARTNPCRRAGPARPAKRAPIGAGTPVEPAIRADTARAGFSLIEVTIAIVILTVLSFTTVLVLVPVSKEHRGARETDIANTAVRNIIEAVHATPFNEILTRYPDGQVIAIGALPSGEVRVSYEDVEADPLIMRLDLSWDSPELGPTQRSFFTVRTE